MDFLVAPDEGMPSVMHDVVDWFECRIAALTKDVPDEQMIDEEGPLDQTILVLEAEQQARAILTENGYENTGAWLHEMVLPLSSLPALSAPKGYELRPLSGPNDIEDRVGAQHAAFNDSRVTHDSYSWMTRTWPYRFDFDWVVLVQDQPVGCCTGWLDERDRIGLLEPVGVASDHRGKGLARAACLAVLDAMRRQGAELAIVSPVADPSKAAHRLYSSLGFQEVDRRLVYQKAIRPWLAAP